MSSASTQPTEECIHKKVEDFNASVESLVFEEEAAIMNIPYWNKGYISFPSLSKSNEFTKKLSDFARRMIPKKFEDLKKFRKNITYYHSILHSLKKQYCLHNLVIDYPDIYIF